MMKHIRTTILVICGLLTLHGTVDAAESAVPEPFQGFDDTSKLTINYDDLSGLLRTVVVDVGDSTRAIAKPAHAKTGTRMKPKVKRFTATEGNRFFYETFTDNEAGRQFLRGIQKSLEALPAEEPLENFSRDEQLAYWLNLYNVTVLNEIVAVYPKRNLKRLLRGRNSILERKLLTVAGVSLSLNDIQFTILKQNYADNPLIMYGLYQGVVGGPNIRTSAYSGANVYHALEDNAYKFVNSNRGTFSNEESVFLVSSLYERNRAYFPKFDSELSDHLLKYLEGEERTKLQAASTLEPNIDDWTVTDMGGTRQEIGRSLAHNNAALLDSYKSNRASVNGGIRVASVIVKPQPKDPEEDTIDLEELERFPVDGANVEEMATEDTEPTE